MDHLALEIVRLKGQHEKSVPPYASYYYMYLYFFFDSPLELKKLMQEIERKWELGALERNTTICSAEEESVG